VTRSLSSNLLKWRSTTLDKETTRVIDHNRAIAEKIEAMKSRYPDTESVDAMDLEQEGEPSELDALMADRDAEGFQEGLSANVIKAQSMEESAEDLSAQAQQLLEEAQLQAQQILQDAEEQANMQAQQIMANARQQGYDDGVASAKREYALKEQLLDQQLQTMEADFRERLSNMEVEMVEHLSAIYEHLFHVELADYKNILLYLIESTMLRVENSRDFMIHVSREDFAYVAEHKQDLMDRGVRANGSIEIIEDVTLRSNECMIETESGIYDCGLDTQLEKLTKKLKLLSYEG